MSATSLPVVSQTAGAGAAKYAAKRRRKITTAGGSDRRPGWVTYLLLSLILVASAAPLYFTFLVASADAGWMAQHPVPNIIPRGNFLHNLREILNSDVNLVKATINSIIVAVATAASVVIFSTLSGFAFSKLRFRGRGPLLIFVVATMAVPTQLGIVPLFIVMSKLHLQGNLLAVILPAMVTAFGVFWMTQYLEGALPYELIEAARVDGASMFRTFWSIALPAARPAAAMLALFTFVGSWTNYFWPFMILGSSNPTLPVALSLLQAGYFKDISLIMAGVVLSIIPLLVLFIAAGRHLVAGIMQGAVKG